jgi:hypothetical protein
MNYFAAWRVLAFIAVSFIGFETCGRTIDEIDYALDAERRRRSRRPLFERGLDERPAQRPPSIHPSTVRSEEAEIVRRVRGPRGETRRTTR